MTNEPKRRHSATSISTITIKKRQLHSSISRNEKSSQTSNSNDNGTNMESDFAQLYSSLTGNMESIKRYAGEILHHKRSLVELRPNGSIVITPRPRPPLPNEIVSLILSFLSTDHATLYSCTLATKQLHAIANPMLWQDPFIIIYNDSILERFIACLFSSTFPTARLAILGQLMRRLRLDHPDWTDARFLRLLPHLTDLDHLTVNWRSNITDASFQHVGEYCKRLTSLHLYPPTLTRVSFAALGRHCTTLRELDWTVDEQQRPEWLALLAPCGLEHLAIGCEWGSMGERGMAAIQQLESLTSLDISDNTSAFMNKLLQRTTTTRATPLWPRMTSLDLSPCDHLDNGTLLDFISSHPQLEDLSLYSIKKLNNTTLDGMAKGLPHLTALMLSGNAHVTVDGILRLIRQCVCLDHIRLSGFQRAMERHFRYGDLATDYTSNVYDWGVVLDGETMDKIRKNGINGRNSNSNRRSSSSRSNSNSP